MVQGIKPLRFWGSQSKSFVSISEVNFQQQWAHEQKLGFTEDLLALDLFIDY